MADAGHHMFTKSVFNTQPLTEKKHKWISSINCFDDVKMLVMTKKKFKFDRLCWLSKC